MNNIIMTEERIKEIRERLDKMDQEEPNNSFKDLDWDDDSINGFTHIIVQWMMYDMPPITEQERLILGGAIAMSPYTSDEDLYEVFEIMNKYGLENLGFKYWTQWCGLPIDFYILPTDV